jgi:LAGLIDADG endonuclease
VGFVEGDGCFTINKLKASFNIVQKDNQILNIIRNYFLLIINRYKSTLSLPLVIKKNNVNPVHSFTINDQDIIYNYIVPFFATKKLLTRKGFDFYI